jgi:succinoglycan biosynthesis protein ExoA
MPILNEEKHLRAAVQGVLDQHYPGELELIMAIGPCTDRTHAIAEDLAAADPRLTIVDNPIGRTPHALNLAIAAARHDILVRVDGHGELGERYIERAVELLGETGAANVGGVMEARGQTPFEEAVAYVYTSRFGLGGAAFHQGDVPAGPAETVFLGVFDKAQVRAVGGFDETMHRAQDWELNYRLRQSGRMVWFAPELRVTYRPRSTLKALMKQMYDTGKWRREVVRRHPGTASVRYLAPPAAVVAIGVGSVAALVGRALGRRFLQLGALAPLGYGTFVAYVTSTAPVSVSPKARRLLPVVLAATHLAWGSGFLVGRR